MRFAENFQAKWQEVCCFIVATPDPFSPSNPGQNSRITRTVGSYSMDLTPSDFQLFAPLKNRLGVKRFADDEAAETELRMWRRKQL
jgi:hypothetical protein